MRKTVDSGNPTVSSFPPWLMSYMGYPVMVFTRVNEDLVPVQYLGLRNPVAQNRVRLIEPVIA
jgi:hypothetical protein